MNFQNEEDEKNNIIEGLSRKAILNNIKMSQKEVQQPSSNKHNFIKLIPTEGETSYEDYNIELTLGLV